MKADEHHDRNTLSAAAPAEAAARSAADTHVSREMRSCWVATAPPTLPADTEPLPKEVEVAVVGGGIVGLTTALMLAREGREVLVLEADRIGRQTTGGSTAKVTVQHGLIYRYLADTFGSDSARLYAESNRAGFDWMMGQIDTLGIDCDLERADSYVYTADEREVASLEREAEAMREAGLPAEVEHGLALPVPAVAGLRLADQAQFQPVRYIDGLAAEFRRLGGRICESTRVHDVSSGKPCQIRTRDGELIANTVVIATHLPILDRGLHFSRAYPYRHMCVAATVPESAAPRGMYISAEEPKRSFRAAPWPDEPGRRLVVAIGESFATGHGDTEKALADLETFVTRHFDDARITHRWGNQDYYSADRRPYVGRMPGGSHVFLATGFSAWGLTSGTAAARLITDLMINQPNDWTHFYDAGRFGLKGGAKKMMSKNMSVAKSWVDEHVGSQSDRDAGELAPGDGAIVRADGELVAGFRDEAGTLHAVKPRCTHMGCLVEWNAAERSWDCHCHGSRFSVDGDVLHGPATEGLSRL